MRRTMRVAAAVSAATLLSARITRAPPQSPSSCANGMNTTARGFASSPPSCVLPTTPTIVRQSPLIGVNRSTSPVHAMRLPIGSSPGKSLSASVWLMITTLPEPRPIGRGERASSEQRNPRRAEVLGVGRAQLGARHRLADRERLALRLHLEARRPTLRSGMVEPTPTSMTPGSAAISRRMRS